MKIDIYEQDGNLVYQVSDISKEYHNVLKDNLYEKIDEKYVKNFDLPITNKAQTINNFSKYAPKMFSDIINNKPMQWKDGLNHFATIAKKAEINWWTNGKAALALMGVDLEVDDLDFIFDYSDINKVNFAFKDYIIEPIQSTQGTFRENIVRYYGVAYSHCRTCFMFEPQKSLDHPEPVHFGTYASEHLDTIKWLNHNIKIAPLKLHLNTYKRWGSETNVRKIKEFLEKEH